MSKVKDADMSSIQLGQTGSASKVKIQYPSSPTHHIQAAVK